MESLVTRWFFSIINSWRLESHFFRHVARDLPLRTPVTYATHWQGSRFFLVQENLHEDPTVGLFTNPACTLPITTWTGQNRSASCRWIFIPSCHRRWESCPRPSIAWG
jgi:hypothetical protein